MVGLAVIWQRPRLSAERLRSALKLSLPFQLHQLSGWGIEAADRLLVASYLGLAAVGRYQIAYVIGSVLFLVLTALQSTWAPFYIGTLDAGLKAVVPRELMIPVSLTVGIMAAAVVIWAPVITRVLAPASFAASSLVVALVAAASVIRATYFIATAVMLDRRRTRTLALASIVGAASNLILNVTLIPRFQLAGAGAATVLAVGIQTFLIALGAQAALGAGLRIPSLVLSWLFSGCLLSGLAVSLGNDDHLISRALISILFALVGVRLARELRAITSAWVPA
jgi:O-antigen/teichoic acid export membrane protein